MKSVKKYIPLKNSNKVIDVLAPLLTDAGDLKRQIKTAHWNVKGENFIALHLLFDKVAAEVEVDVDTIAERIVQLGGEAEIAKKSRLPDYPLLAAEGNEHVAALSTAITAFTTQARQDIDAVDEAGDAVTADILTGIVRGLDKQLWFIEAHLGK